MDNSVGRQPCLSSRQKEIVVGTLLGDGRLECRSKQRTARLRIHHGESQKELVFWKYNELRNIVSKDPTRIKSWVNPKDGSDYFSWYFHTLTLLELGGYHQLFYWGSKKILPDNIESLLTPLALSVWYMDDGCRYGSSIILNTHNFDLIDQKRLQGTLRRRFLVKSSLARDRSKFRLTVARESIPRFVDTVKNDVIESMKHKVVPVTTDPKGKIRRHVG